MIYLITARGNMTCPAKEKVTKLIDEGNTAFKVIIGDEKEMGAYPLFIDSKKNENKFAIVSEIIGEDGNTISDNEIKEILEGEYSIHMNAHSDRVFSGNLIIEENILSSKGSLDNDQELEELISEKKTISPDIDERITYMKDNLVDLFLIKRVIKGYRKYKSPVKRPACLYVDPYLESSKKRKEEGMISKALRSCCSRSGCNLIGEKSVGKNVFWETIAWLLGMPRYIITMSQDMTSGDIYGEKTTDNSASRLLLSEEAKELALAKIFVDSGETGDFFIEKASEFEILKARAASVNIVYEDSVVYDWAIDGGLLHIEEVNNGDTNTVTKLLIPSLERNGRLDFPGRGGVNLNQDCCLFCSMNPDYAGTDSLHEGVISRLNYLYFKQPKSIKNILKASVEAELKKDGFEVTIDEENINQVQAFYELVSEAVTESSGSGVISNAALNIRGFVRALVTVAESKGKSHLREWLITSVINGCPADEQQTLMSFLDSVVTN